jgi:hypothetical protein
MKLSLAVFYLRSAVTLRPVGVVALELWLLPIVMFLASFIYMRGRSSHRARFAVVTIVGSVLLSLAYFLTAHSGWPLVWALILGALRNWTPASAGEVLLWISTTYSVQASVAFWILDRRAPAAR